MQERLDALNTAYRKLPPKHQAWLDGYSHAVRLAKAFPRLQASASRAAALRASVEVTPADSITGSVPVNNPNTDQDFSGFEGVTQSETSTALCGNQAVVGFNDSGSELQSLFFGTGGLSFSGVAVSSDHGAHFKDRGYMNPGPAFTNFVFGDPVLSCSDPNTFYYAQLFATADSLNNPLTAIAVSRSTDGGNTWSDPVAAIAKDGFTHFLDKNWQALDPSNPSRMYVSYTDFDTSGTSAGCPGQARVAIEVVTSIDAGLTFSAPIIIDEVCGVDSAVQASHVAVSSRGAVYVAWERFTTDEELRVSSFVPGGQPSPSVLVSTSVQGGDVIQKFDGNVALLLQGRFRDFVGIDLAVDRSPTASAGSVYLAWDDGRDKSVPDFDSIFTNGVYNFTDIFFSGSVDGQHFSPAARVNSDVQPAVGPGHDHFQPGVAVDSRGKVGVCWYDRRNDAENFRIQRFCATSSNAGATWAEQLVPGITFPPLHGLDDLVNPDYMGDYDGLTSDFTGAGQGFMGAFETMHSGMNPDVRVFSFQ